AEEGVHDLAVDAEIVAPHAVEHRLQLVRQLGDDSVAHRRAHPLDRVDGAKDLANGRDGAGARRVALELEQRLIDGRDVLSALGEKELRVLERVHGGLGKDDAQPSTRCTASSTRLGWKGLTTK